MLALFPQRILFHESLELILQCGKSQRLDKTVGQKAEDDYEKNKIYRRLNAYKSGKPYDHPRKKAQHHKYHGEDYPEGGIMKLYL